ncbi:hypothetical protein VMF7928_01240 [Vibrio marisflavi CECT 7928]|uniref:Uncharacterized protein n=1 Tax=Vibrio marisflavi CECT 7928 TaxID=634439 RepID=A0ABM9A1Y6_9VIBR|nr:hypothetical protein VMF7928_01240 [Vibrio marisflavi CECT 7928]
MIFESKFGIGEVVIHERTRAMGKIFCSEFYEVISICFSKQSETIICRCQKGQIYEFNSYELIGDPFFDQTKGEYPSEHDFREKIEDT